MNHQNPATSAMIGMMREESIEELQDTALDPIIALIRDDAEIDNATIRFFHGCA